MPLKLSETTSSSVFIGPLQIGLVPQTAYFQPFGCRGRVGHRKQMWIEGWPLKTQPGRCQEFHHQSKEVCVTVPGALGGPH